MEPVTLINAFEVPAGEDEAFLDGWRAAAEHLRGCPGFRSTRLHRSLGPNAEFRFVNVAVWDSAEAFQRAVSSPAFRALAERIAYPSHPALYHAVAED